MRNQKSILLTAIRLGVSALPIFVATTLCAATVEVRVSDPDGRQVTGASVTLVPTNRLVLTDTEGLARFENVAPGTYDVAVRFAGFVPTRTDINVAEGAPTSVPVALSQQVHLSETVTVSPNSRDTFESYQPATVLGGEDLQQRLGNTLGATLASEPGVNVRSFGSGNARPVVRGLDNDRVLILENGARTGDLSSQSADHGVTLDPATAGQIEVVRGPATLLYGSSAIGGVVNLVSDEIVTKPLHGASRRIHGPGSDRRRERGDRRKHQGGQRHGRLRDQRFGSAHRRLRDAGRQGAQQPVELQVRRWIARLHGRGRLPGRLVPVRGHALRRPLRGGGWHHAASASPPRGPAWGKAQPRRIHQRRQVRRRLPRL